jgi:hypothetical protein
MDYLTRKMDNRDNRDNRNNRDSRRGVRGSGRRDRADSRDYADGYDAGYEDAMQDAEDMFDNEDGRRGVRGSGRRDRADNRDFEDGKKLKLTKSDMHEWKRMLENADGTMGPHYDMQQIMSVAKEHDIKFKDFTEAELCMVTNMMYADYCRALKKFVEHDKILDCCICLAKAFLEDEDGPEPAEKLALYYHCIVNA